MKPKGSLEESVPNFEIYVQNHRLLKVPLTCPSHHPAQICPAHNRLLGHTVSKYLLVNAGFFRHPVASDLARAEAVSMAKSCTAGIWREPLRSVKSTAGFSHGQNQSFSVLCCGFFFQLVPHGNGKTCPACLLWGFVFSSSPMSI